MTTTNTDAPPSAGISDPAVLRRALAQIDITGWDSPPGEAVLQYARDHVVRPLVRRADLTGALAADATSAGWLAAWRTLARPELRSQASPWGIVSAVVRREIGDEQVATAYRTNPRRAWRLARLHRAHAAIAQANGEPSPGGSPWDDLGTDTDWLRGLSPSASQRPLSLDRMTADGWEPPPPDTGDPSLGPRLSLVVDALAEVGWPRAVAATCVAWISAAGTTAAESRSADTAELPGWRELSAQAAIPTWQTRRLAALLLGYRGHPGLVARMVRDGNCVLYEPDTQRLVRSTIHRWMPSPCAAATTTTSTPDVAPTAPLRAA